MTHLEAIAKKTGGYGKIQTDNGMLWSNWHIATYADLPAKDQNFTKLLDTWNSVSLRTDEQPATLASLRLDGNGRVRRELKSNTCSVWIDEAFIRTFFLDGATIHIASYRDPIAFRREGKMLAVAMPLTLGYDNSLQIESATEEEVFARFACEENGWHMQSAESVLKRLRGELEKTRRDLSRARDRMEQAEAEVEEYESEEALLQRQISELSKASA